jgi:iron complex transport system substrate-binding protein
MRSMDGRFGVAVGVALLLAASALATRAAGGAETPVAEARPPEPDAIRRIVSATLATDEILLELVPPERVVALSTFANDPAASNVVEQARAVRRRVRGDPEALLALEPDVVFTSLYVRPESTALLARAGVPIARMRSTTSVHAIEESIVEIGRIVGEEDDARAIVERMRATLAGVRDRVRGADRPRVLLHDRAGYTAGRETVFDELLSIAGGRNAAAEAGVVGHAVLETERLLALDPDIVLDVRYVADGRAERLLPPPDFEEHPLYRELRAVRDGAVHELSPRRALSASHHAAEGAVELARILHPERFEESERTR